MAAVADGNSSAFDALVALHLDAIHGYLYRLTGSRHDAEDLAQETFLRLWKKAGSYEPGRAGVSTWLHSIAHNLSIDAFRKKREVLEPEVREIEDRRADPAQQIDSSQQQALLEAAIAELPERQRAAILLCQVRGFSNVQAAGIMDLKVRALESLLARARRSLRESLSARGALRRSP